MGGKRASLRVWAAVVVGLMVAGSAWAGDDGEIYGRDWKKGEKLVARADKTVRKGEERLVGLDADIAKAEKRIAAARSDIAKLQEKKLKTRNDIDQATRDRARGEALMQSAKAAYDQAHPAASAEAAPASEAPPQ